MKKILCIGIGDQYGPKQRITIAFENKGMDYVYARWSDLSFCGERVYIKGSEINFNDINGVFFDIFRLTVHIKGEKIKDNKEIDFHLENELHILMSICQKKGIYAPNRNFLLTYPYYNKFSQSYIFASHDVPCITTFHFSDNKSNNVLPSLEKANLGFPMVVKESYGGGGDNVWKIENKQQLEDFIRCRRNSSLVFQPFVENNADYRVIVIGGKCVGIMKRSAKEGQWKNNFSLGGSVAKHFDEEMEKFAVETCRKLNLDMVGLDILHTKKGMLIIEANLFFGLDGFEAVFPEANVPMKIVELIQKNTL